MELFEYIKSQLPQMPNVAIMRQLGASEELIEYIRETPWNTNWNIIETFECESEEEKTYTIHWGNGSPDTTGLKEGDSFICAQTEGTWMLGRRGYTPNSTYTFDANWVDWADADGVVYPVLENNQ